MTELLIRTAGVDDLVSITEIDHRSGGTAKPGYWADMYQRYGEAGREGRHFLVAEQGGKVIGFTIGEVRAWEFGSPPTGWVFAINVAAETREGGVASRLFDEICRRFRADGVTVVRTMISRDDTLILSFFRSMGLTAGPYIELEKRIDEVVEGDVS